MNYIGNDGFAHDSTQRLGVLLINLGTPDAPTVPAVRRYLREFLSDPRVIEAPRWLWWPILQGILLLRPARSAHAYRSIWRENGDGSPLLHHSRQQLEALRVELGRRCHGPVVVELAMRYGNPSIPAVMAKLRRENVRRLLVLPLYPQYSATTTASAFDRLSQVLQEERWLPELRFVNHYHDHEGYIRALANSIREHWQAHGRGEKLLFSFHGIPRRYLLAGDPYYCECQKTARLVAAALKLDESEYMVSFQSRVGREEWLRPYTEETVRSLARSGIRTLDVISPGFSADCLETLEEIAMQNEGFFRSAGGDRLRYIPALNARPEHIRFLAELALSHMQGWPETSRDWSKHAERERAERARQRARQHGAEN